MNAMKIFLADSPPIEFTEDGDLRSGFPFFIMAKLCDRCHRPMVLINDQEQCPSCPVLMDWVVLSRIQLRRYEIKHGKPIQIELREAA